MLRKRRRILQSAPNTKSPLLALMFFLTSSRMFGRRPGVRMSLLVSADAKSATGAVRVFGPGTRLLNKMFDSLVRFQHLPVPFELYSDGIDLPDFVVIDPAGLDASVDEYHEEEVSFYGGLSRMVNRNDAGSTAPRSCGRCSRSPTSRLAGSHC